MPILQNPPNAERRSAAAQPLEHALAWRLADADAAPQLAEHFIRAATRLGVDAAPLWIESLPFDAGSDAARQRRERELGRALHPTDGSLRGLLLRYADATADLILVARVARIGRDALYALAQACDGGDLPAPPALVAAADIDHALQRLRGATIASSPEWNIDSGERGAGRLGATLDDVGDAVPWLAALGCVLARYTRQDASVVTLLQQLPQQPFAAQRLVLDSAAGSAAALQAAIAAQLAGGALPTARENAAGSAADCGLALVFAAAPAHADADAADYRPCVAAPFPLTLVFQHTRIDALFDRTLYSTQSVDWLLSSLLHVRTELARDTAELGAIGIVAPSRHAALLPPAARIARATRIDHDFDLAAQQTPHAVALACDDDRLSYAELQSRANRLARLLQNKGVRRGEFVGLCLERSIDLVVAMLAVLKAGAAYVPMDPMYPADRLAYTCTDAAIVRLIATRTDLVAADGLDICTVADLLAEAADLPDQAPAVADCSADDPAYVIYTSGSTGRPKGVVVPHRNVTALIGATRADFGLHGGDVWTLFHSCAFDFSVWEIWGCLLTSAQLVVVPYWTTRSPARFRDLLAEHRVSVLNQTPSAFSQLMAADQEQPLGRHLRLVIFGGEPLDCRALLPWLDRHAENECRLVNMFGITETTVHVTRKTIGRREALQASRSVGPPIPGWQCYVLDAYGHLLPPGVHGEIYVGGAGVASGYHNRAELTGERFVADPFQAGGKLYRSGDRGRLLPCGSLEHLGRLDSQVKLRGFRIELDEIRKVLLSVAGVTAAAVVFRQDDPADSATARLDAYVVPATADLAEIRRHARRTLPEFMLPASLTAIAELPLTQNGKLDPRRLPPAAAATPDETTPPPAAAAAARPALSESMREVWQQVLRTEVTLDDNFFDLGGNSLQAIRLIAAARERDLPALDMRQLYVHQTIRRLLKSLQPDAADR